MSRQGTELEAGTRERVLEAAGRWLFREGYQALNMDQLARDLVSLMSETFPRTVTFNMDLLEGLPPLLADQGGVEARGASGAQDVRGHVERVVRLGAERGDPVRQVDPRQRHLVGDRDAHVPPDLRLDAHVRRGRQAPSGHTTSQSPAATSSAVHGTLWFIEPETSSRMKT